LVHQRLLGDAVDLLADFAAEGEGALRVVLSNLGGLSQGKRYCTLMYQ